MEKKTNVSRCDQCKFVSTSKTGLLQHSKKIHFETKIFCDLCDFSASRVNLVTRHKERIHIKKRYTCDQCSDGIYSSQCGLKRHKDRAHKGIVFPCHACDYNASRKYHLKRHIYSMHNTSEEKTATKRNHTNAKKCTAEEKIFACDDCEYKTDQKILLKQHKGIKHNRSESTKRRINVPEVAKTPERHLNDLKFPKNAAVNVKFTILGRVEKENSNVRMENVRMESTEFCLPTLIVEQDSKASDEGTEELEDRIEDPAAIVDENLNYDEEHVSKEQAVGGDMEAAGTEVVVGEPKGTEEEDCKIVYDRQR